MGCRNTPGTPKAQEGYKGKRGGRIREDKWREEKVGRLPTKEAWYNGIEVRPGIGAPGFVLQSVWPLTSSVTSSRPTTSHTVKWLLRLIAGLNSLPKNPPLGPPSVHRMKSNSQTRAVSNALYNLSQVPSLLPHTPDTTCIPLTGPLLSHLRACAYWNVLPTYPLQPFRSSPSFLWHFGQASV